MTNDRQHSPLILIVDGELVGGLLDWAVGKQMFFETINTEPQVMRVHHQLPAPRRADGDHAVVVIGNDVWPAFSRWARAETGLVLADITEGQGDGEFYRLQHRPEPIDDRAPDAAQS